MRTSREFYLRHDFAFYDSGILGVMPPVLFLLYDLLRRYVWRSIETADPEVRRLVRGGHLVARINQSTLAEMLGYDRRETVCRHLQRLVRLGWVKVQQSENHGVASYVLGEVVEDSSGGRHEVFYADAFLQSLIECLDTRASQTLGAGSSMRDLPLAQRQAAVKEFIAHTDAQGHTDEPLVSESAQGLCENAHEGYAPAVTQEIQGNYVPLRRPKNENDTEPPGGSAPRPPHAIRKSPRGAGEEPKPEALVARTATAQETEAGSPKAPELGKPGFDLTQAAERYRNSLRRTATETLREERTGAVRQENLKGRARSVADKRALAELETLWLKLLREQTPGVAFAAWGPKEKAIVSDLVVRYGDPAQPDAGRAVVEMTIHHVVTRWPEINEALLKGRGAGPTIAFLHGFHERLTADAQKGAVRATVEREVDAWYAANPHRPLPDELAARWEKVR